MDGSPRRAGGPPHVRVSPPYPALDQAGPHGGCWQVGSSLLGLGWGGDLGGPPIPEGAKGTDGLPTVTPGRIRLTGGCGMDAKSCHQEAELGGDRCGNKRGKSDGPPGKTGVGTCGQGHGDRLGPVSVAGRAWRGVSISEGVEERDTSMAPPRTGLTAPPGPSGAPVSRPGRLQPSVHTGQLAARLRSCSG